MILGNAKIVFLGQPYDLTLQVTNRYVDGNRPVIQAYCGPEQFATITVNLPNAELEEGEFLVKTWTENEWVPQLLNSGIFEDTGKRVPTGFVKAQVWRLKTPV